MALPTLPEHQSQESDDVRHVRNQCRADEEPSTWAEEVNVHLEVASPNWRLGDNVQFAIRLENNSARQVCFSLGCFTADTDDATVLVAAGLQLEATCLERQEKSVDWEVAKVLEPRAAQRAVAVVHRERALFLPPRRGAKLCMAGRCVGGLGLGTALQFGGMLGDAAEVLVPLVKPQHANTDSGALVPSTTHCLRFALGSPRAVTGASPQDWAWVGPYEPPAKLRAMPWSQVVSQPVSVTVSGGHTLTAAAHSLTVERVPLTAAVWTLPFGTASPQEVHTPQGPPPGPHPARSRPGVRKFKNAGKAPPRKTKSKMNSSTLGQLVDSSHLVQDAVDDVAMTDQDVEIMPSTASSSKKTKASRAFRLPPLHASRAICGPEHGVRWRALSQEQDPLADPLLLELAEEVDSMRTPMAVVAFCGQRLKSRPGQRLMRAVQALGARAIQAPDLRKLAEWAQCPRQPDILHELVLVADWHIVQSCVSIILQVLHSGITILGVVALCGTQEAKEASAVVANMQIGCPCKAFASMVF